MLYINFVDLLSLINFCENILDTLQGISNFAYIIHIKGVIT